jgi:regulator of sigma E protease
MNGATTVLPIVADVLPQSAAEESGFQKGDEVLKIEGKEVDEFAQIQEFVLNPSKPILHFEVKRGAQIIFLEAAPKIQARQDMFGDVVQLRTLGISTNASSHIDLNLRESFVRANAETYRVTVAIFKTLGELIVGSRSVKELGGPVKIAQYSGKTVDMGIAAVLWFMALISINLGAMNLLPIPVLDGGHLFYYIIEALRGKPLSHKVQQIGFRFGLSVVLALMVFTTINDIINLLK